MVGKPLDDSGLPVSEGARLPEAAPPTNHGHTVAAWVTVTLVMVGAVVGAAGVLASQMWLLWLGLGLMVVAAVVGRLLKVLGFGQPDPSGPVRGSADSGSDVGTEAGL